MRDKMIYILNLRGRKVQCLSGSIRRLSFFILFLLPAVVSRAQITYKIDGFSNQYYAQVHLNKTSESIHPSYTKGWIAIYSKATADTILKVNVDRMDGFVKDEPDHGKDVPEKYSDQGDVFYEDVNFDGKKDLAIEDGLHSCYGGPSYQIYLADPNGFSPSKSFTALAQNYCGMFRVDTTTKKLHVMTKSGCCWHQSSVLKVVNNQPKLMKRVETDNRGDGGMLSQNKKIITYENGKKKVKKKMKLDMNNMQVTENICIPVILCTPIKKKRCALYKKE